MVLCLIINKVTTKAVMVYAVTRRYFKSSRGKSGSDRRLMRFRRKERPIGVMSGAEKKVMKGQM